MRHLIVAGFALMALGTLGLACGKSSQGVQITKEEAKKAKGDWPTDWCEDFNWYGDGTCDPFCPKPDPDCSQDGGVDDGGQDAEADAGAGSDAGSGPDAGIEPDAGSDGNGDSSQPEWDLTLAQLQQLIDELVVAKYEHGFKWMGWADYSNHCYNRMRAVFYYLNFGELPQYRENESAAIQTYIDEIQALEHSVGYRVDFEFAGSMCMQGEFETDDVALEAHLSSDGFEACWVSHVATLVYTELGPRMVDMAFSRAPLTIEQWQSNFLPAEFIGTCAVNDQQATSKIINYRILKSFGQSPPIPATRCAYQIRPLFKHDDGSPYTDDEMLPAVRDDPHSWAFSTNFVRSNCGDTMYLMSNPSKIPLIRLKTTARTYRD